MNINNLRDHLKCMDLEKYAFLNVNCIGRGERNISIVENNGKFDVYFSGERGSLTKKGENLPEKEACEMVIDYFETVKSIYDYYNEKGTAEENGFHFR